MDDEIIRMLKQLRLGGMLSHWDEYMDLAQKQGFSNVRFLKYVLEQECKIKDENARRLRMQRAQIEEPYVIETFPFERQPNLDKKRILSLYDAFDFVEKSRNLIWIGPTGCGKTGLATSFLIEAIHRGHTGRYILFPDLVNALFKSAADHTEQHVTHRFLSYDCLFIDELDYVEVEPVQVGLFFTLMHKRHRKKPTLITSNLGFSEWRSFLKNDRLTAALIDRLTENSHVINMKNCVSLRPKQGVDHDLPGDSK
jgi:DNA replication protein DnaC